MNFWESTKILQRATGVSPWVSTWSSTQRLARLGLVAGTFACLLLLVKGTLDPAHTQGSKEELGVVESAFQSEPVTPGRFSGDLRDLPRANAWEPGDPVRTVPRHLTRPHPNRVFQELLSQPVLLVRDPLLLELQEDILGTFAQTTSPRWGGSSSMNVDPVDDCTFWYTNAYVATNGIGLWGTRMIRFRFPSCENAGQTSGMCVPSGGALPPGAIDTGNCGYKYRYARGDALDLSVIPGQSPIIPQGGSESGDVFLRAFAPPLAQAPMSGVLFVVKTRAQAIFNARTDITVDPVAVPYNPALGSIPLSGTYPRVICILTEEQVAKKLIFPTDMPATSKGGGVWIQ